MQYILLILEIFFSRKKGNLNFEVAMVTGFLQQTKSLSDSCPPETAASQLISPIHDVYTKAMANAFISTEKNVSSL